VRFCLPGDFLAPSCLSNEFKGEQMVDVLNSMGLDLASFGNHEFEPEINASALKARMDESRFAWLNANFQFRDEAERNACCASGKMLPVDLIKLSDSHFICLFGVLGTKSPDHVGWVRRSKDILDQTFKIARDAQGGASPANPGRDVGFTFVAMTHQTVSQDRRLARMRPELTLIMGGHDHNVMRRGRVKRC